MDQIFEMQNEIANLKALKDIPFELVKILRRAASKGKFGSSMAALDETEDGRSMMHPSNSRKSIHRSKSRKEQKRPPASNDKRDKNARHLGIEINSALDRMQEFEAQNELLVLENQKLKDEIIE